ncbi:MULTISPECIES: hypothetical protein [Idiomarina]|uniref:hypothetical protein n=1 Tax=Idiomarina TaxID=135575 RepID=UPI00129BCA78|nr:MULTISPECIES: hypothetical protein [Idiomarina]MRJ41290.1 hypothetical protein [Idiomarina sp. FeN1]NCU56455.1 hypothetical protein [Idiomarina sp. FenA--70]NCU59474.1 hypothetical protein [Idiomarina sp. FenBw--71]UUN12643.1 hypothetical protein KGF88_08240 [Idiomarina loihiensis]
MHTFWMHTGKMAMLLGLLLALPSAAAQQSAAASATQSATLQPATPTEADWPDWVFAPVSDYPTTHLYAVGFGVSKATARQHALAEISLQVSADVNTLQRSVLARKRSAGATEIQDDFSQVTLLEALGLQLEQVEEQQSALLENADGSQVAVLLAVPKAAIVAGLHDRLRPLEALNFPFMDEASEQGRAQQLLWSLQYRQSIDDGLRLERAMAALDGGQPMARMHLEQLQREVQQVWQNMGVRVVANYELQPLVGALSTQLPAATDSVLWLRLTEQRKRGQKQGKFLEQRVVQVQLTSPTAPFTVYQQQQLRSVGEGASASAAEQAALRSMQQQLEQPLRAWLFL